MSHIRLLALIMSLEIGFFAFFISYIFGRLSPSPGILLLLLLLLLYSVDYYNYYNYYDYYRWSSY
jgi:hypothetical protein